MPAKRVRLSPEAKNDLLDIRDYIAADNPKAAAKMLNEIRTRMILLAQLPGLGPKCPEFGEDLRHFAVRKYVIYYRRSTDGIEVARVLHSARNAEDLL